MDKLRRYERFIPGSNPGGGAHTRVGCRHPILTLNQGHAGSTPAPSAIRGCPLAVAALTLNQLPLLVRFQLLVRYGPLVKLVNHPGLLLREFSVRIRGGLRHGG